MKCCNRGMPEHGLHRLYVTITSSFDSRDVASEHLVLVLAEEAAQPAHPAQKLAVSSVANALAARLLARFTATAPEAPRHGTLSTEAVARVRSYIEENVGERISLEDLARIAQVSRFHFARQFRLRTGESPMGYLLRARIERAKRMLSDSAMKIAEIAVTLGFADQSHFTRTFRRFVGTSPSEYRRPSQWWAPPEAGGETPQLVTP